MTPQSAAKKVLARVEETTGFPVIVNPDPSLGTLATVKLARHGAVAHVVAYHPRLGTDTDYAICLQCGFVLRAFLAPEADRFSFGAVSRGREDAGRLLDEHLRDGNLSLPEQAIPSLANGLFVSLMLQLCSIPIELRVDAWLVREYPELAEPQRAFVSLQLEDNLKALSPKVRRLSPASILRSAMAMYAAFASYWSKAWGDPVPVAPYRETGHLAAGESLMRLWYDVPDDPGHDRKLIEAWGGALGLQGWYELLPFAGTEQ